MLLLGTLALVGQSFVSQGQEPARRASTPLPPATVPRAATQSVAAPSVPEPLPSPLPSPLPLYNGFSSYAEPLFEEPHFSQRHFSQPYVTEPYVAKPYVAQPQGDVNAPGGPILGVPADEFSGDESRADGLRTGERSGDDLPDDAVPREARTREELIGRELMEEDLTGREEYDGELDEPEPEPPFGYNLRSSNLSWLVGHGDDFGMFSLEGLPTLKPGEKTGLTAGLGFHFLSGPSRTDMPPRLFDFQIGFQRREWITATWGYDISAHVGVFSDFEGSARKGVRFPGHAVGYYRWSPTVDLVLGIEYLDRDDISLLPVVGMILSPQDNLRLELVFPRPCVQVQISPERALYLAGELGGGTWAIERMTGANDVVTYRDLRLLLGLSHRDADNSASGVEIGYVFGRDLSYRSGVGDYAPQDTVLLQFTQRY